MRIAWVTNDAMAVFVKRYAIAMTTASRIKYATIVCAILGAAVITRVRVTNLASTINAEVSIVSHIQDIALDFKYDRTTQYNCIMISDPCEGGKACGECAGCRVVNHVAQCSCPANYYGNALINCAKTMIPCDGSCECDEIGFCTTSCYQNDCSCGEVCHNGKCRIKCDVNNACPKVKSKKIGEKASVFLLIRF